VKHEGATEQVVRLVAGPDVHLTLAVRIEREEVEVVEERVKPSRDRIPGCTLSSKGAPTTSVPSSTSRSAVKATVRPSFSAVPAR
jgi:hypothetical protein